MAVLFYRNLDGQVLGATIVRTNETDKYWADLNEFLLDHELDSDVYEDVIPNMSAYKVVDGELQKDGVPVVLNDMTDPLETAKTFWKQIGIAETFLDNAIPRWDALSASEKQAWLVSHFDEVLRIERGLLHLLKWIGRRYMRDMLE